MRKKQLSVSVGPITLTVFMELGFFDFSAITKDLHQHRYTEVHLLERGTAEYLVNDEHVILSAGDALIIPPDTFHKCFSASDDVQHSAFQLIIPAPEIQKQPLPPGIVSLLHHEIALCTEQGDCGRLSACLAVICTQLFSFGYLQLMPICDPAYVIHEYMSKNYRSNLTLADLAGELNLSEKQTERLVQKYTGRTFRKELARHRMEAARHLLETESISMAEVAERVGYRSYSGFWKAFHLFQHSDSTVCV